jgi:micrococcal nuclease
MIRKTLEGFIGAIVLVALVWGGQWLYYRWTEPPPEAGLFRVLEVVDGDEIIVGHHGKAELVRYIGINAPEVDHPTRGLEPGGQEAAAVNRQLVDGKWVRLELTDEVRDRFDRVLAYVWVPQADGRELMANAEMVARGYARVATFHANQQYAEQFRDLEGQARTTGRGLWSGDSPAGWSKRSYR